MKPMTNEELRELGTMTLHGDLPPETSRRVLWAAFRLLGELEVEQKLRRREQQHYRLLANQGRFDNEEV